MSRLDDILRQRTEKRHRIASDSVARLLDEARREGIEITVIGSLAAGRFRRHSDVDLLVRGKLDVDARALAERIVAGHLRGSGLPYDIVFADDLPPARLQEFLDDLVPPPGFRETGLEDRSRGA